VVQHSNYDAAKFAWSPDQTATFQRLLQSSRFSDSETTTDHDGNAVRGCIKHLTTRGYAVIDHDASVVQDPNFSLWTTAAQQDRLSDFYLEEVSSQGPTVRTDRVHFLSRAEAQTCGVQAQYDLLMGLAHFLNDHLNLAAPVSPHLQPVTPATIHRPLTLPRTLQFAEYAHGDYYVVRTEPICAWFVGKPMLFGSYLETDPIPCPLLCSLFYLQAHSDNALTDKITPDGQPIRINFRASVPNYVPRECKLGSLQTHPTA
jgi:hypothetical protein